MKTILRLSAVSLLLPAWLLGGNLPDEPEKVGQGKGGEIRKKIEELDQKINNLEAAKEALHAEAEKAEQEAERKQALKEIKNECNGMLKELANELTERDNDNAEGEDEEEGKSVAREAFRKAFKKHVAECQAVNKQLQAIKDAVFLQQARDLADQLEVLNRRWWMVLAPKYQFEVEFEAMSRHLKEEGTYQQRETLKKLRRLHEEDLMSREKEFESFKTRRQARKMMEKMKREIWGEKE